MFAHGLGVFADFAPDVVGDGAGSARGVHQGADVVAELVVAEGGVIGVSFLSEGGDGRENECGESEGESAVHGW